MRIHIELPGSFGFSTELPIYTSHINHANHLDNASLLGLVSEARVRFFAALGYRELDVEGAGIIVADAAVKYQSEAFHGEVMVVEMTAGGFSRHGCDLPWRMCDRASGREVARGKTGIAFFDYQRRKLLPVPEGFRRRFS